MRKADKVFILASFLAQFTLTSVSLSLVFLLSGRGISASLIGSASSMIPLFYFLSCLGFQYLYRYWKGYIKLKLSISLIGMALSLYLAITIDSVVALFAFLSLYGIFQGLLWPNIENVITGGKENDELSRYIAYFNVSWCFASSLSSLMARKLSEVTPLFPLYISLALFVLTLIVVLFSDRPDLYAKAISHDGDSSLSPTKVRYFSFALILFSYVFNSILTVVFPLYASDVLSLSEGVTGLLLLFKGIFSTLAFIVFSRLKFYRRNPYVVIVTFLFLALISCLLGFFNNLIVLSILFSLYGVVFSLCYVSSIYNSTSGSKNRVNSLTIHECMLTLGTIIGSSLCAIIYQKFGFRILNVMTAILLVLIAVISVLIMGKMRLFGKKREA